MEFENWKDIEDFWDYKISSFGRVVNKHGREMILSPTLQGDLTVGLVRASRQYRRSVKVLVARAFVDGETEVFDTPIQLDGDKTNLYASNIRWRPRWFAWKYSNQFSNIHDWFYYGPILDTTNEILYTNILEATMVNGSLGSDIYLSIMNGSRVFPTGERYIFTN